MLRTTSEILPTWGNGGVSHKWRWTNLSRRCWYELSVVFSISGAKRSQVDERSNGKRREREAWAWPNFGATVGSAKFKTFGLSASFSRDENFSCFFDIFPTRMCVSLVEPVS